MVRGATQRRVSRVASASPTSRRSCRQLMPESRLHLGFLLALVIIVVAWFVLTRTAAGLRMRAVGPQPACGPVRGHRASSDPAPRRARERRHRRSRGRERGGRHPVPADVGVASGLRLHRHRRRDAGRAHDARRAAGCACSCGDLAVGASSAARALDVPSQMGGRHPGHAAAGDGRPARGPACARQPRSTVRR